jgi:hypothetical protein
MVYASFPAHNCAVIVLYCGDNVIQTVKIGKWFLGLRYPQISGLEKGK